MDLNVELKQFIRELSEIAGLVMDEHIDLHREVNCTNKQLQILHKGGFIPNREILGEFLPSEQIDSIQELSQDESAFKRIAIVDLLGAYFARTQTIVIYEVLCKLVAYSLRCNVEDVILVVLAHEAAHAVTHLGVDHENMIWDNFELASKKDKELFAQIYPYKLWEEYQPNGSLSKTFMSLETNQPNIYHAWRIFEGSDLTEINNALYKARRCQQSCAQSDHQNDDIIERIVKKFGVYAPLTNEEIEDTFSDETESSTIKKILLKIIYAPLTGEEIADTISDEAEINIIPSSGHAQR